VSELNGEGVPAVVTDHGLPPAALRRVTAVLCASQIVSWGVLFYAFPVLAPSIAEDTGWSPTAVVAAFTVAQLISAGAGLLVARRLHHQGPRAVMTLGSLLAVTAVVAVAYAGTWWTFLGAWCLAGTAMAATLYPPAFAALTAWGGSRRLQALTALTLVGGLASTVFAPLTAVLDDNIGWRHTYAVLALLLSGTVILHALGLRQPWTPQHNPAPNPPPSPAGATIGRSPQQIPGFTRTVAAFALAGLCVWSLLIAFVPLLTARGFSTSAAATALGIGGIGQVCGRLAYRHLDARTSTRLRTRLVFVSIAATTLALAVLPGPYLALVVASFLAGASRGIFTLLQATAVTDRWGTTDYARLTAILSFPLMATAAFAPWLATLLATALGTHALALSAFAALAAASTALVPPDAIRPPRTEA